MPAHLKNADSNPIKAMYEAGVLCDLAAGASLDGAGRPPSSSAHPCYFDGFFGVRTLLVLLVLIFSGVGGCYGNEQGFYRTSAAETISCPVQTLLMEEDARTTRVGSTRNFFGVPEFPPIKSRTRSPAYLPNAAVDWSTEESGIRR